MASDGPVLSLDDLLSDFQSQQREQLLVAVDKLITDAIREQGELLSAVKSKVQERHLQSLSQLRSEINSADGVLATVLNHTLNVDHNKGLLSWIDDVNKKSQAADCVTKLCDELKQGRAQEFRDAFEALLVVYMQYLKIPMERGVKLINRIEDLREALHQKAGFNDELSNLVERVRWACSGVRTIGNVRSRSDRALSESERLELCSCLSAIGAAMPTLAGEFEVCKPSASNLIPSGLISDPNADLATLIRQAASAKGDQAGLDPTSLEMLLKLVTNGNTTATMSPPSIQTNQAALGPPGLNRSTSLPNRALSSPSGLNGSAIGHTPPLPPGYSGSIGRSQPPLPPGFGNSQSSPPLPPPDHFSSMNGLNTLAPSFHSSQSTHSLSLSLGFDGSSLFQAPPLPPDYSSAVGQPPLPPSSAGSSPQKMSPPLPPSSGSPSPQNMSPHPPGAFAMKQSNVPSQALLKLVPEFKFYYDRPTELPKESDRVRMAMFARMINHMNALPKATLCPYPQSHDLTCPLSHTYFEVMTYNPLYKRLICRQASHYWGNQVQEDVSCVCLHVDTGLDWEWLNEDKRTYCLQGAKCTNKRCVKSHSFEEMCWYNPSYKIKKCEKRIHDHIARARGTIAPPLDCNYYHIEEGKNSDRREFMVEDDHVGQDIRMLFVERSHKPLAERLEALRYARDNNL